EQWIDQLNSEEPDIILIAGDIIDNHLLPLQEQHISESFHRLKSTYGIYAAVVNHEYIAGIDKSIAFLQEAGICVLRDSVALVDSTFFVVGRDDRSNRNRLPLETLTHSLDKSKPVILLDHQPVRLEETEANNITLQISGHTHHGQLIPISWITRLMFEKPYGYLKKGNSHIYVTSGIGIWGGKFRIGTQSEYVVIKLH
ncbi:MAG: metallophosphoesterase, partial [Bacteroidales bacterium]|nr:metallophosphoesterase [Bacteroidales bacterium]